MFKPEESEQKVERFHPNCLLELPRPDTEREPLTKEQLSQAVKDLTDKAYISMSYPKTSKLFKDPPINGQHFGLYSFTPSRGAKPDEQGFYGTVNFRGAFQNMVDADDYSKYLIKEVNSYAVINYCPIGFPTPLTTDRDRFAVLAEIDVRKKVEGIQKEEIATRKKEEQQQINEVMEQQERLYQDVKDDRNSLDDDIEFYTQLRVKKANLLNHQDSLEEKMKEALELVAKVEQEVADMDARYPEYKDQFKVKYEASLKICNIKIEDSPILKYLGL